MKFSVIIATWNEGAQIASTLKRLKQISASSPLEIIVVDGNSDDGTADIARQGADQVIVQPEANRGIQLDAGARAATGDLLVFLRPDVQPPGNWQQVLEHFWLAEHPEKVAATAFCVDFGAGYSFRLASRAINAWVDWRGWPNSNHCLATTPQLYRESGGFPPIPFREDIVFCERLSNLGEIVLLKERVWVGARRMRRHGVVSYFMKHAWLSLRFKLGVSPQTLWRSYCGL